MRPLFISLSIFLLLFFMFMGFRSVGNSACLGIDVPTNDSAYTTNNTVYTQQYRLIWPGNGTVLIGKNVTPLSFTASRPFTLVPLTEAMPMATPMTAYGFGAMSTPYATWFCAPSFVPCVLLNLLLLILPKQRKQDNKKRPQDNKQDNTSQKACV
jgi:hypothetical protein